MKEEVWKPVVGYDGLYEVSNLGRVKSLARTCATRGEGRKPIPERILKPCVIRGYNNVVLCYDGKNHKHKLVHRLVAEAFLDKKEGQNIVEHLDCNPMNCCVENLRWSNQRENCNNPISRERNSASKVGKNNPAYGKRNGEVHNARKVACFTRGGEFVKVYPSVAEATRETGIRSANIISCTHGRRGVAGGFIWRNI